MSLYKQRMSQTAQRNKDLIDCFLAGATVSMLQTIHSLSEGDVLRIIRQHIKDLRIEKAQEKRKKNSAVRQYKANMKKKGVTL